MKALTVRQPWATLIALGVKRIETRSWPTKHRGPLAIHAAKGMTGPACELCDREPFRAPLIDAGHDGAISLPRGAVIATARLVDVVSCEEITEADDIGVLRQLPFGDFTPGRYAWLLDDVRPLPEPVPAKGALSFWEWAA